MILVSGSLAYDYIMDFPGYFRDHILPEKLHVLSVSFGVDTLKRNFGGTAGNIAYNLALLGERPTVLSTAGNDFGEYGRWLRAKGVELRGVNRVEGAPTAAAYIITDQADNQICAFHAGAMRNRVTRNVERVARGAKIAIVSPGNLEDMRAMPRLYKKYGVPYVYDPGQNIPALSQRDLREGITGARVFISNDYELAMVLKKTGWKEEDVLRQVEILVTTLGEKGSVIEINVSRHNAPQPPLTLRGGGANDPSLKSDVSVGLRTVASELRGGEGGVMKFVIPPAKPKNTSDPTGAGDAYRAGLIKGLLLGLPWPKGGRLAATVAVYTVEKYGTQTHTFTWKQLLARYKKNFGESLV